MIIYKKKQFTRYVQPRQHNKGSNPSINSTIPLKFWLKNPMKNSYAYLVITLKLFVQKLPEIMKYTTLLEVYFYVIDIAVIFVKIVL